MLDVLIKGAEVFDGEGRAPVRADIGVNEGRIAAVGDLSGRPAHAVVDAAGCCACPGFIDAHSHSDSFLLVEPNSPSKVRQGITTEVVGNCGASAAPIRDISDLPFDWQFLKYPCKWRSMREYLKLLAECRPAVNVVPIVGHNRLRIIAMGYEDRPASADEMRAMKRMLEESMDQGARGLSTGLIYRPGKYAAAEEIAELAAIVARRRGIYTTHMRSEGAMLRESVAETLNLGCKAGVRIQISHLKTAGAKNWHYVDEVLAMIEKARAEGLAVAADRYPYVFSCTDLDILLPDWLAASDRAAILRGLGEPKTRDRLRGELAEGRAPSYWEGVIVATSTRAEWRGKTMANIAAALSMEPAEAVIHILAEDKLLTQAFYAGMSEDNMWKIYSRPFVMVGTDASLRAPGGFIPNDHPHPRAYGSFTRFLRAALDRKTVPAGEAVRKMTSLPADHFGLRDRGRLRPGCYADIVIFEPKAVADLATYAEPHQFSRGIRDVMVNGQWVLSGSQPTGKRPGRILTA
ncbi:MAG: D-aminoacylase [Kiritimatiellia bacterium]